MQQINYSFESNKIEQDVQKLGEEVVEKKQSPETQHLSERELIKQTIHPVIQASAGQATAPKDAAVGDEKDLPDYLKDSPQELKLKVESLVGIVFEKGIEKAAHEAQKFGPFVLDAFHDAVTDKLYDELKKRKII